MKKIFTLCFLAFIYVNGFSQTTYYWVGGAGPASFTSTGNWNTALDGSGDSRSVLGAMDTDVLIFDGTNIGGSSTTTGNVVATTSSNSIGRLIFQNNVNVKLSRTAPGSANITIVGEGTALNDLVIEAGSVVTLGDEIYNYDVRILLGATASPVVTGSISGTLYMSPLSNTIHTASYITARNANSLVFENGANCYVTDSLSVSPFNGSVTGSVLFKTGSSLYYYTGRSPFGNSSTVQFANFETGSNFYMRGSNVSYLDGTTSYASSNWVTQKSFANIFIQNGATLKADGPVYRIDNFSIDNGCTFTTHTSGQTPVLGNLTVNGAFGFPAGATSGLVMGGHSLQTISGTGTIDVPNLIVANYSDVALTKSINVTSSTNIVGKINFGAAGNITGTGSFTSRVASAEVSGTGTSITAGSYQLSYPAPSGINGYRVTGPGLSPETNVIGFGNSANIVYLSKPALSSQVGGTYTFTSDTATLQTANSNGYDPINGSITNSGNQSFQSGTNYIVDAITVYPFGISTTATGSVTVGSLTVNAPISTNYNVRLAGTLTLNSGVLNIRAPDTLRILNGTPIEGAPFNASKYIISGRSGNDLGVLRVDGINGVTYLPVGTSTNFLPVTLTPPSAADFAVSVFEGVTLDGTTSGMPFTSDQKLSVVDAVWTIDRMNGTGSTNVELNWVDGLEGAAFATYPDVLIGVARHDGTSWENGGGTGNNTTNRASNFYDDFSPFIVSRTGSVLPVNIHSVAAKLQGNLASISWNVSSEISIDRYEIERSDNRINFTNAGFVSASQRSSYSFTDPVALTGVTYYRLKIIGLVGEIKYSEIVVVKPGNNISLNIFPNPVVESINISGLKNNSIIRISSTAGHLMLQQKTNDQFVNIDLRSLKPGTYILEVFNDGKRTSGNTFVK
jgi:hypothetical protein